MDTPLGWRRAAGANFLGVAGEMRHARLPKLARLMLDYAPHGAARSAPVH